MCSLVIKLFSPNIKYRNTIPASVQQATPFFPLSMRLLRVVSILIQKYHNLLVSDISRMIRLAIVLLNFQVTECEIFLSLIVKFLDPDKPTWQRALALEVLHKMTIQPELLNSFCKCYDLKKHTTHIFQDIVSSLGAYVQSLFHSPQLQSSTASQYLFVPCLKLILILIALVVQVAQTQPPVFLGGVPSGPGVGTQAGFYLRGVWLPVVITFPTGSTKAT